MIENGIVGAVGAFMALLVAAASLPCWQPAFQPDIERVSPSTLALIGGSALLAMLIAAIVAWGSVRVRPLEVLRYE